MWPSYKRFYIGYQDTPKNATCVEVVDYGNNNAIVQRYNILRPDFAVGQTLFDGHIIICTNAARPHLALREILQQSLNTPSGTTQAPPRTT